MNLDFLGREALEATMAFMRNHADWGAPILFGAMLLEGVIFTTFLLSGALMIVTAGALVQAGVLAYGSVFAAIVAGFWLGDWINFELGRRGEMRIRSLHAVKARPKLVARAERLIAAYGWAAIFVSRFMGPTRPVVTLLAGACRMPSMAFHVATGLSTLVLAAGLLNAGMVGVQLWERVR